MHNTPRNNKVFILQDNNSLNIDANVLAKSTAITNNNKHIGIQNETITKKSTIILPELINRRINNTKTNKSTISNKSKNKSTINSRENATVATRKNTVLGAILSESIRGTDTPKSKKFNEKNHEENFIKDFDTIATDSPHIIIHKDNSSIISKSNSLAMPLVLNKLSVLNSNNNNSNNHSRNKSLGRFEQTKNKNNKSSIFSNDNLDSSDSENERSLNLKNNHVGVGNNNKSVKNDLNKFNHNKQEGGPVPSKFSTFLKLKDPEVLSVLDVQTNNKDNRRREFAFKEQNQVQLFINILREKLEKNSSKKGGFIPNIKPSTLKPGSMLSKIYTKCLREYNISQEIEKVLNNEKHRSLSNELNSHFEQFSLLKKTEHNYFIEEILRIKDKDENQKVFLYNKSRDPSNIDISKISDHLAYVNRQFFIERYGYNYSKESDFIFQDVMQGEKTNNNINQRAEEKRIKNHDRIEGYLDSTIKKKKELITHLTKKLSQSLEKEKI